MLGDHPNWVVPLTVLVMAILWYGSSALSYILNKILTYAHKEHYGFIPSAAIIVALVATFWAALYFIYLVIKETIS